MSQQLQAMIFWNIRQHSEEERICASHLSETLYKRNLNAKCFVRDAAHGSFGVSNDLHNKVEDLQSKLAVAEAEAEAEAGLATNMQSVQHANLISTLYYHEASGAAHEFNNASLHDLDDDVDPLQLWEPLWT